MNNMNNINNNMNNMNNMNNNMNNNLNNNINNNNFNNNINNNNENNINKDNNKVNLVFIVYKENGLESKYQIIAERNETLSTVISRYIDKTQDNNVNFYIFNGEKLNESLTVGQLGLKDGNVIFVVKTQNIIGAFYKKLLNN